MNACFLSAHRDFDLSPLPRLVRNHRMANNRQVRRHALQEYQELRFRNLVVRPRPNYDATAGFGKLPKQRRSGHWKNVAHGPGFSLHRWTWIDSYETRPGEEWPSQPPTVLVR